MSKKNNPETRRKQLEYDRKREAEANLKKLQKIEKRKKKDATMADANVKNSIKKKRKGFKLRKNVVIKGIKIKDAQSKKDARAAINEMREKEMDVDD